MNDSPRNKYSIDEELEVLPQLVDNKNLNSTAIHFTHNYFSTDSNYGCDVLKNFINSLAVDNSHVITLIISDSAVKLLTDDELLSSLILISEDRAIYVSESALREYSVDLPDSILVDPVSDSELINLIIEYNPIIIS